MRSPRARFASPAAPPARSGQDVTASARRLVKFTKATVIIAFVWTGLCAAVLTAHQTIVYLQTGEWDAFPISSVLGDRGNVTYTIASSKKIESDRLNVAKILDHSIEIPAIVPLLIALLALLLFWAYLSRIEKEELVRTER